MPDVLTFPGLRAGLPKCPPIKYGVEAKAGGTGEVYLYGVIGDPYDGITAKQFAADMRAVATAKSLTIMINSVGGYVTEGRAIFNRLKAHPAKKTVLIDGEASSIASLIAMAGDEIRMGEGALMLIHKAWMVTVGNEDDHEQTIRDLRTVDAALIDTYAARTGQKRESIIALMKENRYMTSREAVELGFADHADGSLKMAAMAVDRQEFRLPALPAAQQPNRVAAQAAIEKMRALIR